MREVVLRDGRGIPGHEDRLELLPNAQGGAEVARRRLEELRVGEIERRRIAGTAEEHREERSSGWRAAGKDARRPDGAEDPAGPVRHDEMTEAARRRALARAEVKNGERRVRDRRESRRRFGGESADQASRFARRRCHGQAGDLVLLARDGDDPAALSPPHALNRPPEARARAQLLRETAREGLEPAGKREQPARRTPGARTVP